MYSRRLRLVRSIAGSLITLVGAAVVTVRFATSTDTTITELTTGARQATITSSSPVAATDRYAALAATLPCPVITSSSPSNAPDV